MLTFEQPTQATPKNDPHASPDLSAEVSTKAEEHQQQYLAHLEEEYEQTVKTYGNEHHEEKQRLLIDTFHSLSSRLKDKKEVPFSDREQSILKLKLARYLQHHDTIDVNTLFDALIESPNFIKKDKGGLHTLLEVHEQKTIIAIAEMRKERAEIGDKEVFNPWENLFTTKSGNYYLARLLNMPHLRKESAYMNHCVGTSASYLNRIKQGEIEILSFRKVPHINQETNKLEGDEPIITIEYNLKTNTIEQMKKKNDQFLTPNDPYFDDVLDALKQLRTIPTDKGVLHNFSKIQSSELTQIPVQPDHFITEHGEVHFKEYDSEQHGFILKIGEIKITPETPKEDVTKLLKIVKNIDVQPSEIARTSQEINEDTTVYVGNLEPNIFTFIERYPIKHLYSQSLEGEIKQEQLDIPIKTPQEWEEALKKQKINISKFVRDMLYHKDFTTLKEPETIHTVRLTVADLGFTGNATTKQIFDKAQELGLDLCPPETGPAQRLNTLNQPLYAWEYIAMKQIVGSGGSPDVFGLERGVDGLWLDGGWASPDNEWRSHVAFVFRLRPPSHKATEGQGKSEA